MGRRNKYKPRIIPQQDKRIIISICFCQLIVVFSCVSLIYLTVAIYMPSYRAFNSGFETRPVMCQTVKTNIFKNCSWASCGEWCLTKTSGFCPQIHATTRQNGTNVQLLNCTRSYNTTCLPVHPDEVSFINCNKINCDFLNGIYNCSLGICTNYTKFYNCEFNADGPIVDSVKDNKKLNGFFECKRAKCVKIRKPMKCERYCESFDTLDSNVLIKQGNTIIKSKCSKLIAYNKANGDEPGEDIPPRSIWEHNKTDVLIMSCHNVTREETIMNATDCINGTIYNNTEIAKRMNFSMFRNLYNSWHTLLDDDQEFLPMQHVLTIFNSSQLFINLEGCVNTLRGECYDFLQTHGQDGHDLLGHSRYPCFYKKNDSFMVLARFDLDKTWKDLIISITVPTILFIISFSTLCIIMQCVRVGDDTRMRCKFCISSYTPDESELTEDK